MHSKGTFVLDWAVASLNNTVQMVRANGNGDNNAMQILPLRTCRTITMVVIYSRSSMYIGTHI